LPHNGADGALRDFSVERINRKAPERKIDRGGREFNAAENSTYAFRLFQAKNAVMNRISDCIA